MDKDPEKSLQALKEWETNDEIKALMQDEMVWSCRLNCDAYFGETFEWDGEINVQVKLPKSNKRRYDELIAMDGSAQWLANFRRSFVGSSDLPAINQLAKFVKGPLPAKVGLSQERFDRVRRQVGEESCARVFTVDDRAPCHEVWEFYFLGVLRPADWRQGVARSFHGYWRAILCGLVSNVFDLQDNAVFRNCTVIASSNTDPPTGTLFKLGDIGLLRTNNREQEADKGAEEPVAELRGSLNWRYGDNVPYVFGYTAKGAVCMLFALSSRDARVVEAAEIGAFEPTRSVSSVGTNASPTVWDPLRGGETFMVMHDLSYALGGSEGAPVETSEQLMEALGQRTCRTLYESWQGPTALSADSIGGNPMTLDGLFQAIEGVLTILVELHASGWMHRDLRWSIVFRNHDHGKEWFLIDFADAASSPQAFPSGTHLL